MRGYTTDYVNLIAGELRDHYENGFPILKELVQNADDAKGGTLILVLHEGFRDASHPLLKGPGLWFFNDGALDGPSLHPEWDKTDPADWKRLTDHGKGLAAERNCGTWFLLWLPLRMKEHLRTDSGRESAPIIDRFPGDDPPRRLTFLTDRSLAHAVAEMLPLLRHLERVEHRWKENSFVLTLEGGARLLGDPPCAVADGRVVQDGQPLLAFSASWSRSPDTEGRFAAMKDREEWPRTRYRDELGHERPAPDKSSPEAAVLFCSGIDPATPSRLRWAVFLPVGEDSEPIRSDGGERGHSLVMHGQFFLDRGRRRIHGLDQLHETPADLAESQIEESRLRTTWNQRLAQEVLLPLVLPALERHAERHALRAAGREARRRFVKKAERLLGFLASSSRLDLSAELPEETYRRIHPDDEFQEAAQLHAADDGRACLVAAEAFNAGRVRFPVSTEAGGEGIDLQERCAVLVHVDMPWNPMRLHQRVGRLSRYGQRRPVTAYILRNPDTVEARIWDLLNEKLERVQQALAAVMEQQEDISQLVIGMADSTLFNELYSGAQGGTAAAQAATADRLKNAFESGLADHAPALRRPMCWPEMLLVPGSATAPSVRSETGNTAADAG